MARGQQRRQGPKLVHRSGESGEGVLLPTPRRIDCEDLYASGKTAFYQEAEKLYNRLEISDGDGPWSGESNPETPFILVRLSLEALLKDAVPEEEYGR